jgi:hypothetical protein
MTSQLQPPDLRRDLADADRRLGILERRIDTDKTKAPSKPRSPIVTVAASDTPEMLAVSARYQCDGTADEVEIHAALDEFDTDGGAVLLLPGTFTCSATIRLTRQKMVLVGSGRWATTINSAGFTFSGSDTRKAAVYLGASYQAVHDLTVNITGADASAILYGADHSAISGVNLTGGSGGATTGAIHAWSSSDSEIFDNWIEWAGTNGIYLEGTGSDATIQQNRISAATYAVTISVSTVSNTWVTNNDLVAGTINDSGTGTDLQPGNRPGGFALIDADIPASIARDTEVTAAITTHEAASDPHTGYLRESVADAKGDLLAATAADTWVRLAVGTDGQILTADATQTAGVKWAAASGTDVTDAFVPYYLTTGETFTVPEFRQALFVEPIELDGGTLDVEGLLIEVVEPPDLSALVHMGTC